MENERESWEKDLFLGLEMPDSGSESEESGNRKYGLSFDPTQAYQLSREYFGDDPDSRPQTPLLQILADQLDHGDDDESQNIALSHFCRVGTNLFLLDGAGLLMVS